MNEELRTDVGQSVTINDVARDAGVSIATVSRVINGGTAVSPALTGRVQDAIRKTGFVPNQSGRALRRQLSDILAAIVPDTQDPFFTSLVAGMDEIASENGLSVMLSNTASDPSRERAVIRATLGHRMVGVVFARASGSRTDLRPLVEAGVPTVLVDVAIKTYRGDSVFVDNRLAGRLAAEHLLDQGYTRPAVITGPSQASTSHDRVEGFREAIQERGLELPGSHIRSGDYTAEGAEAATQALLLLDPPPDTFFSLSSPMTAGVFRALRNHPTGMPGLGLVGMDDDLWMSMVDPSVTVVTQPALEIGRAAAELILARRADPSRSTASIVLSPGIIIRDSTRRAERRGQ